MKLNELKNHPGSTHRNKIVGRGPGSGHGKTACRGENGQKSRSGGKVKAWFEGGQNPLYKRIPRRGFSNARFTTRYAVVNVSALNIFDEGTIVTPELLREKKLTVKANLFTNSAINKIEELGGKAEVI